jgi:predicted hotdog family 3-hydroxylacyl-ACP dehydratase
VPATAPDLLELQRTGPELRVRGHVPEDLLHFEGHFPGQPVLPGVVQLHWAIELARAQLGIGGAPSSLEALKFHEPLRPDRSFELRIAVSADASSRPGRSGRRLRFELDSEGRTLSSGRVRFDGEPSQHTPVPLPPPASEDWPLRLPHAGPMRWIERVLAHHGGATLCEARIGTATPLCVDEFAPSWLALELLAQGMAAQGGLVSEGAAGLRGWLVAARRIELRTCGFSASERLWVHVQHLRGETGFVVCECALGTGKPPACGADARDLALARGTLTAFVQPAGDRARPEGESVE